MKPYYQDQSVTLYHGDSYELAGSIECDAIVTDPPYGDTSLEWDKHGQWLASMPTTPGGLWFFTSLRALLRTDLAGWQISQEVIWEKHNGSCFHADRFRRVHELAVHCYKGPWKSVYRRPVTNPSARAKTVRRKGRPAHCGDIDGGHYKSVDGGPLLARSVIRVRSCHGYAIHPTQKPIGILTPLIEYSCPPGGLVLDPFAGSGSTLEAARLTGRRAIGIEANEEYCERAAIRLAQQTLSMPNDHDQPRP